MNKKEKAIVKKKATNFFGGVGYLSCTLQWFWMILLYFSLIESFALFINNSTNDQVAKPAPVTPITGDFSPNSISILFAVVITMLMLILTLFLFYKIPLILAKTSKKIIHNTAEMSLPLIAKMQHKKDTSRFRIQLTPRLIVIFKAVLIIAPIILAFMSQLLEKQVIDFSIAMYISFGLAGLSTIFFVFQYSLASLLSVKKQNLW